MPLHVGYTVISLVMIGDRIRVSGYWTLAAAALLTAGLFLFYSSRLASDLAERERQRMLLWADAVAEVLSATDETSVKFPIRILEDDLGVPALLVGDDGDIIMSRNIDIDSLSGHDPAVVESVFNNGNEIKIETEPGVVYRVCYGDSALLRGLRFYPYIELCVITFFLVITYFAIRVSRKADQNRIWVGLSKETAHQLGTPILSLMGWMECLRADASKMSVPEVAVEMEHDVMRLADVASRFYKIGTRPVLVQIDLSSLIDSVADYMRRRVSSGIVIEVNLPESNVCVQGSAELLRWMLENLMKNAADAMEGSGKIAIDLRHDGKTGAVIEITDTGKGIPLKKWKSIFQAGYTTKGRGWGLGLTLARRIVVQYHRGSIAVVSSEIGRGTTFRIILP